MCPYFAFSNPRNRSRGHSKLRGKPVSASAKMREVADENDVRFFQFGARICGPFPAMHQAKVNRMASVLFWSNPAYIFRSVICFNPIKVIDVFSRWTGWKMNRGDEMMQFIISLFAAYSQNMIKISSHNL